MNKYVRMFLQIALCVGVIVLGLILLQAVVNNSYFYPSNSLAMLFPELSEQLINVWGTGLMIVLIAQSTMLLIVGIVFLLANWKKLLGGRGTRKSQIAWCAVIVGFNWIIVFLLFGATSLTGGGTFTRWLILLIMLAMGSAQTAITITCNLGPHYESLKPLDR